MGGGGGREGGRRSGRGDKGGWRKGSEVINDEGI